MTIQPIPTRYAGCHFRSRLEARWAVFFDALGVAWEYEPQGFGCQMWDDHPPLQYLPDFWLPATETWVEVKGTYSDLVASFPRMAAVADFQSPMWGMQDSWTRRPGLPGRARRAKGRWGREDS